MNQSWKKLNQEKTLFKSYYCVGCKQTKPCGKIIFLWKSKVSLEYCCSCAYQSEQVKAREYSNYEKLLASRKQEQKEKFQQYQLLRSYPGCPQCRSLAVDAYSLYNENKLICQPCRMVKEGSASSAISFLEQQKWFKSLWKVNLTECLENFAWLPVNKKCADKWSKDKGHLSNYVFLEQETREICSWFTKSLRELREKLKECKCVKSEKVRVSSDDYAWCERCETSILAASKKRVIKNRNDPKFWGLKVKERILCGDCLANLVGKMPSLRKAEFNRYRKVKRL